MLILRAIFKRLGVSTEFRVVYFADGGRRAFVYLPGADLIVDPVEAKVEDSRKYFAAKKITGQRVIRPLFLGAKVPPR